MFTLPHGFLRNGVDLWGGIELSLDFNDSDNVDSTTNGWGLNQSGISQSYVTDIPGSSGKASKFSESTNSSYYAHLVKLHSLTALETATDFTVMVWAKRLNRNHTPEHIMGVTDSSGNGWGLLHNSVTAPADRMLLETYATSTPTAVAGTAFYGPSSILNWNLYTVRWDNSESEWYISWNDTHFSPKTGGSPTFSTSQRVGLGRVAVVYQSQGVLFDACRVFSTFKTDKDINGHYNSGTALAAP